jgi:hypothetical protein
MKTADGVSTAGLSDIGYCVRNPHLTGCNEHGGTVHARIGPSVPMRATAFVAKLFFENLI